MGSCISSSGHPRSVEEVEVDHIVVLFLFNRDYNEGGSPAEGGEGSSQPQDMTPQQQHQQYLGDSRPELEQFPDIQWAGTPIPGEELRTLM